VVAPDQVGERWDRCGSEWSERTNCLHQWCALYAIIAGMSLIRPIATSMAGAACVALVASTAAVPASATIPPLQINGYSCLQSVFSDAAHDGRSRFGCTWNVTGGSGSVTAAYFPNEPSYSRPDGYGGTDYTINNAICSDTQPTSVLARFTDNYTGQQVSSTATVNCID
jgi:hypothetical protein